MKLTVKQLRQIIAEEVRPYLKEASTKRNSLRRPPPEDLRNKIAKQISSSIGPDADWRDFVHAARALIEFMNDPSSSVDDALDAVSDEIGAVAADYSAEGIDFDGFGVAQEIVYMYMS
jgi:hypothetical protein